MQLFCNGPLADLPRKITNESPF